MDLKKLFSGSTDSTWVQFFRYIFVGGGATVVQYLILVFLTELFHMDPNLSAVFGFLGGLGTNYVVSTCWVFDKGSASMKNKMAEAVVFCLIGVIGLGITEGIIWLFDKVLAGSGVFGTLLPADKYYLVGQVLATGLVFFWNFFARKILLYNKKGQPDR